MKKIYCYVDESGQDTRGKLFLVSVIITDKERKGLEAFLERVEGETGKGKVKWTESKNESRKRYIKMILSSSLLEGKLHYAFYENTTKYLTLTILTTARAITILSLKDYKAVIYVDGLPKSLTKFFGKELRHLEIKTEKVRGVRKEETDCFIRLADALCGFVRAAIEGQKDYKALLAKARERKLIREL